MSRVVLCIGKRAEIPYCVPVTGMNIYSVEELCYFFAENAFLLDGSIVNRQLVDWLEEQCELTELAELLYEENKIGSNFDITFFTDFSNVRNRICYKLVNAERNKEMLSDMPHIRILDLALVFYVLLNIDKDGTQTIAVRNYMQDIWKVSTETLYEEAKQNTSRLFPCDIKPMRDIIREMMELEMDKDSVDEYFDMMPEEDVPVEMYVISNKFRISGAVAIFYKDVLKNLANQLDCDLYILPSSIHETIAVPASMGTPEELAEMVHDANMNVVQLSERLSNQVYHYDKDARKLMEVLKNMNQIKVLIGNDTADCGMAWAGAMKAAGMYAITRRCDGNSVLNSIKSEAPDVAVLDERMPFCDALEVIRRLKMEKK